jgi:hypothetical protein
VHSAARIRGLTQVARLPLLRRLLTVGGFLVCGWLLSGVQTAHAADGPPAPPLAAITGGAADSVKAAVRDVTAQASRAAEPAPAEGPDRDSAPPRPGLTDVDVSELDISEMDVSEVAGRAVAAPARAAPRPPADKPVPRTARTGADRPDHAVRGVATGLLGSVTGTAVTPVTNMAVGAETGTGLTSSATATVGSAADALNRPLGGLTAPLGPLSTSLGTLAAPLGPLSASLSPLAEPLRPLSAPLRTLTAPLGPLTAPLETLTAPVARLAAPVTAPTAMLVTGVTAGVVTGIVAPPGYATTSSGSPFGPLPRAGPGLAGSVSAELCRAVSVFRCAPVMSPPIVVCSVRGADGARAERPAGVLCLMMGWSPPEHGFGESAAGPGRATSHNAPAPGGPRSPLSDHSYALPKTWHGDGAGDPARPWEARVIAAFEPAWVVAPPAIRTAADEPAFSPD